MAMKPLANSYAATELEAEMRDMFIRLFEEALGVKTDEINVYGAPHIGPFSLIEREVARDGLTVLRATTQDSIRHLFRAWRFRNPRRGTHFLRTYLQVLFGPVFEIRQMYQKKGVPYPEALASIDDIAFAGESVDDYFLTSRLRVDIDTESVPSRIQSAARTAVAARFVLDIRVAKRIQTIVSLPHVFGGVAVARTSGVAITVERDRIASVDVGPVPVFGAAGIAYFERTATKQPSDLAVARSMGGDFRITTDGHLRTTKGD